MSVGFSYWSDPLCIWAFVAQPKLERVLADFAGRVTVDYRVVPVFGSVPARLATGSWSAGGLEARIDATAAIAREHGREDVSGACWRGIPASSWSPGAAVKAVFAMARAEQIAPEQATAFQWSLRERFFVEDANIALRTEQLAVAEQCGIPTPPIERQLDDGTALALLWEDHQARERLGVRGSPSYVFDGGRTVFYGNFSVDALLATVAAYVAGEQARGSDC